MWPDRNRDRTGPALFFPERLSARELRRAGRGDLPRENEYAVETLRKEWYTV